MALLIRNEAALAINHARDFQTISDLSHDSGKAEVAREVIHNAGNVFNSINISVKQLQSQLEKSSLRSLPAIVALMNEQGEKLGGFITSDPKGKQIPAYFQQLSQAVESEQQQWWHDLTQMAEHVEHVRAIIQSQSGSLESNEVKEMISPAKLLNRALGHFSERIEELNIDLQRKTGTVSTCALQKHKVMQVMENLLKNAIETLALVDDRPRRIELKIEMVGYDRFCFVICDNGPGISAELKEKVFSYGFSTKEGHSGFGLHSAANLAVEMGGKLSLSTGEGGVGACFRLELPMVTNHAVE